MRQHEPRTHGNALRPEGQGGCQPPAIVDAAGGDNGDLDGTGGDGNEDHGGRLVSVGGRLVTRHDDRITPQLGRLGGVLCQGRRSDHLASVRVNLIDKPGLAQGIVEDGNLLLYGYLDLLLRAGTENDVDAEGLVRQLPDLADILPHLFGGAPGGGKYPQSARVADRRHQIRIRDPVHPRQHDRVFNTE